MADEIKLVDIPGGQYPLCDETARTAAADAHTEAMAAFQAVYAPAPQLSYTKAFGYEISLFQNRSNSSGFFFNFNGALGITGWAWYEGNLANIPRTFNVQTVRTIFTLQNYKISCEYDNVEWEASIGGNALTENDINVYVYFEVNGNNTDIKVEIGCVNNAGISFSGNEYVALKIGKIFVKSGDWVIPMAHDTPLYIYT